MERLFLLPATYLFIVIVDTSVRACLLFIEAFLCLVEEIVVDRPYIFVTKTDIEMGALRIGILCIEFPAVMIDRTFSDHCADRSFHIIITSFPYPASAVVLLLLSKVTQKHF